jgi:hypothetical protein
MKRALYAVVLAGCASGSTPLAQQDAPPGGIDAKVFLDAPIDGRVDAAIDAAPHIDARIDAPVDAAPHIDAPIDACVPMTTELLANPAFDLPPVGTGWTEVLIDPAGPIIGNAGFAAQTAPYKAWMGGYAGQDESTSSVTDQLYQDFIVPAGTTQLVLTGYYAIGTTEDPNDAVYDTESFDLIQTNGTPIENIQSVSNLTITGNAWVAFSHTFTSIPAGQTVRLRITSTNDIINASSFLYDTLSLKATHCP